MSAVESTRRDLAVLRDWAFCPVPWQRVTEADTVLGRDAMIWHVVSIEKHFATAMVRLAHGKRQVVVEVDLADPVHVLDDSTGFRRTEHEHGEPVRLRTLPSR